MSEQWARFTLDGRTYAWGKHDPAATWNGFTVPAFPFGEARHILHSEGLRHVVTTVGVRSHIEWTDADGASSVVRPDEHGFCAFASWCWVTDDDQNADCPRCGGATEVSADNGNRNDFVPCPRCSGQGIVTGSSLTGREAAVVTRSAVREGNCTWYPDGTWSEHRPLPKRNR